MFTFLYLQYYFISSYFINQMTGEPMPIYDGKWIILHATRKLHDVCTTQPLDLGPYISI